MIDKENTLHILTEYAPFIRSLADIMGDNQENSMNHNSVGPAMSQKIFSMNLSVETVSLYLLCCAVADTGTAITGTTLQDKWNGSRSGLEQELRRLEEKNILCRGDVKSEEDPVYQMVDEKKWR